MSNSRIAVLLGLVVLVAFGPIVAGDNAQPASRYSLTAALAEHGSVDLGPYRHELGVDFSTYKGRLRSDKAPGQPILAVPVYLVGRALGAEPATHVHVRGDLGLWWETLWSATLPLAILLACMFLICARFARRRTALAVTAAFGLGTMMLPLGVNLFGHDLAALFAFGAWLLIERERGSAIRAAGAGALGGLAVFTEYETAIILAALAGYLLVRNRTRLGWFALGAAGPLAGLAWYQWRAFGAPWRTPAAFYNTRSGYSVPGARAWWDVLFGQRGLWIGAPVALLAIACAVWLVRAGAGPGRRHAVVALAILVPYLGLCAGWSGFALLEDPGPRYVLPALPFLAVPLALLWERVWRPAILLAAWGAVIAISAATTFLLLGIGQPVLPELPRRVLRGQFLPTIWSMAFGSFGVMVHLAVVALVVALFVRSWRRLPGDGAPRVPAATPAPVGA